METPSAPCRRQFALGVGPQRQCKKWAGRERLRPHGAEDMEILGSVSASVRAGGGAPAPVQERFGLVGRAPAGFCRRPERAFYLLCIDNLSNAGRLRSSIRRE